MNIIENHKGDVVYYEFKNLKELDFINHLFSSRIGWSRENAFHNTSQLLNVAKSNIISLKQVHGDHIEIIKENSPNPKETVGKEGDGLITNLTNIVLMTYHADCVPIYFVDIEKRIIGLAHGGWRGTYKNISGKMIKSFKGEFDSKPEDIIVAIGPSIGPCCYEVSKELADEFSKTYTKYPEIAIEKDNRPYLDLWRLNYLQIRELGVLSENIIVSNTCTSCNIDKFHSYRKEKGTKDRMVAAINLI